MSDKSNDDTDKNTTIKDKDSDKKFFASLGTWLIVLTVNIMLGSYIIYASKILHVIQLPTNLDADPYTNTKENENAKEPISRITYRMKNIDNNTIGINYLDTIIQPPQNEVDDADATIADAATDANAATDAATISDTDNDNPPGTRIPFFTKINVNPDNYKKIFNENGFFGSSLYAKNTNVQYVCLLIVLQKYYCYIYYGICLFFTFIYGDKKGNYIWESMMLIFGFPLFLLYCMGMIIGLCVLLPIWILWQIQFVYYYESTDKGICLINDKQTTTWVNFGKQLFSIIYRIICSIIIILFILSIGLGMLSMFLINVSVIFPICIFPYIFYIFYNIISIECYINNNSTITSNPIIPKSEPIIEIKTSSKYEIGLTILKIIGFVIVSSISSVIAPLILIINYIYSAYNTKQGTYSIATLLLSKIEIITYVIAIIFLWCTQKSYGWYVFSIVFAVVLLLFGLRMTTNLIQFIFYPFITNKKDTSLFIPVLETYQDPAGGCIIPEINKPRSMANIFEEVVKLSDKPESVTVTASVSGTGTGTESGSGSRSGSRSRSKGINLHGFTDLTGIGGILQGVATVVGFLLTAIPH
jgi:hypothetical protein